MVRRGAQCARATPSGPGRDGGLQYTARMSSAGADRPPIRPQFEAWLRAAEETLPGRPHVRRGHARVARAVVVSTSSGAEGSQRAPRSRAPGSVRRSRSSMRRCTRLSPTSRRARSRRALGNRHHAGGSRVRHRGRQRRVGARGGRGGEHRGLRPQLRGPCARRRGRGARWACAGGRRGRRRARAPAARARRVPRGVHSQRAARRRPARRPRRDARGGGSDGHAVLVVEPLAGAVAPWWEDWADAFQSAGARSDEWRFPARLPDLVARFDRAAGLRHHELTASTIYVKQRGAAACIER